VAEEAQCAVMHETTRITPWRLGQTKESISQTLRMSWAHARRRVAAEEDAQAGGGEE
jgi:hypothetical protein